MTDVAGGYGHNESRPAQNATVQGSLAPPAGNMQQIKAPMPSSAPGRTARWCWRLLGSTPQEMRGQGPFSSWAITGELSEPNQRVIRADCERTRGDVEHFRRSDVRLKMEAMLTCWCRQEGVRYKQGLNELLAPFVYLQTDQGPTSPDDDVVFLCFRSLLRRFVPFFDSEDFVPLQCAFVFFRRLLLYHHPDLHNLLLERSISPDMFCTPWFLTLFASKTPLRITYQLWDRILERGEPTFFIFLAVALVAGAKEGIFAAERSHLPEILTSLCITSRKDLEDIWAAAESLHRATPATFIARLRKNVMRRRQGNFSVEEEARFFDRLERERCFFVLPEEVIGHCYPPKAGELRQPWHPSLLRMWRFIILDLRPLADFELQRIPTSLHFDPLYVRHSHRGGGYVSANAGGLETALEPGKVFEALKATLGEDCVSNHDVHICLLGSSTSQLVRDVYEMLSLQITLRHVSVASGGFEAVSDCVKQQQLELIQPLAMLSKPKSATGKSVNASVGDTTGVPGVATANLVATGLPALQDRPGNWPPEVGLEFLPKRARKEVLVASDPTQALLAHAWPCIAILVKEVYGRPSIATMLDLSSGNTAGAGTPWAGCACTLTIRSGEVLLWMERPGVQASTGEAGDDSVLVLSEFSTTQVLRVTSKKNTPNVLIFYFRDFNATAGGASETLAPANCPGLVLYFPEGSDAVRDFISALKTTYDEGSRHLPSAPTIIGGDPAHTIADAQDPAVSVDTTIVDGCLDYTSMARNASTPIGTTIAGDVTLGKADAEEALGPTSAASGSNPSAPPTNPATPTLASVVSMLPTAELSLALERAAAAATSEDAYAETAMEGTGGANRSMPTDACTPAQGTTLTDQKPEEKGMDRPI